MLALDSAYGFGFRFLAESCAASASRIRNVPGMTMSSNLWWYLLRQTILLIAEPKPKLVEFARKT